MITEELFERIQTAYKQAKKWPSDLVITNVVTGASHTIKRRRIPSSVKYIINDIKYISIDEIMYDYPSLSSHTIYGRMRSDSPQFAKWIHTKHLKNKPPLK